MDRPGHEEADFFVGVEVERSPMYGQNTLFVVGVHETETILTHALNNSCPHIYLGANHSFVHPNLRWETMILELLQDGILVTLDFDVKLIDWVLESGATEYNNFYPMISVKLPYIDQLGYNATLKLDDTDFENSNPGVWCHQVRDLMDRNTFTPWKAYKQDKHID